jgi:hypothetical protein
MGYAIGVAKQIVRTRLNRPEPDKVQPVRPVRLAGISLSSVIERLYQFICFVDSGGRILCSQNVNPQNRDTIESFFSLRLIDAANHLTS